MKTRPDQSVAQFVGREAMILDGRLAGLRLTPHWPKTISVLAQHRNLKRVSRTGRRRCCAHPRALCRSCGFLGPGCRSEASDIAIPLDGNTLGQFRLLLHGYFFLDSGRRQIEGLIASAKGEAPSDASGAASGLEF